MSRQQHPKTRQIVHSYLSGKSHREVSREHGVPYTTCVDICHRYVKMVPVLRRPFPAEPKTAPAVEELNLTLDNVRTGAYEDAS